MFKLPPIFLCLKHILVNVNEGNTGLLSVIRPCKLDSHCTFVHNVLEPKLLHFLWASISNVELAHFALFHVPNLSQMNLNLGTIECIKLISKVKISKVCDVLKLNKFSNVSLWVMSMGQEK